MKAFILFLCAFILDVQGQAQTYNVDQNQFVVFNLQGRKIGPGKIVAVTDTSMFFLPYEQRVSEIKAREIGKIRAYTTKGTGALIGAAAGAGLGLILSSKSVNRAFAEDGIDKATNSVLPAMFYGVVGALIGGIADIASSHADRIRGDLRKWGLFKDKLEGLTAKTDLKGSIHNEKNRISMADPVHGTDRFTHRKTWPEETGFPFDCMK